MKREAEGPLIPNRMSFRPTQMEQDDGTGRIEVAEHRRR